MACRRPNPPDPQATKLPIAITPRLPLLKRQSAHGRPARLLTWLSPEFRSAAKQSGRSDDPPTREEGISRVLSILAAVLLLYAPAHAQKRGGILTMSSPDSPGGLSLLEEATVFAQGPIAGVFNNLIMMDQHAKHNSLDGFPSGLVLVVVGRVSRAELRTPPGCQVPARRSRQKTYCAPGHYSWRPRPINCGSIHVKPRGAE